MFHATERLTCVARASARTVHLTWDGPKESFTDQSASSVFVGVVLHRRGHQSESTWLYSQAKQLPSDDTRSDATSSEGDGDLLESCHNSHLAETESGTVPDAVMSGPVQDFMWADYTVTPATTYTYTLFRVTRVADGGLSAAPELSLEVTTQSEDILEASSDHVLFFNRGVAGSQGYNRRFGQGVKPGDRRPAGADDPWEWLSHGLEDGLLRFLQCAEGPIWAVRGACYEFSYAPVLHALAEARDRQADVKVIYDAKPPSWSSTKRQWNPNGPLAESDPAITAVGLSDVMIPRRTGKSAIQHNKFFVLVRDGVPVAVWTGSTNITASGIFGQTKQAATERTMRGASLMGYTDSYSYVALEAQCSDCVTLHTGNNSVGVQFNVGHVCRDQRLAQQYLEYWDQLAQDPALKEFQKWNSQHSPLPTLDRQLGGSATVVFSPRANDDALRCYSELARGAKQGVFLTAAFGVSNVMAEGLLRAPPGSFEKGYSTVPKHWCPTYVLLESPGRGKSPQFVNAIRKLPYGHVAVGSHLPVGGLFGDHEAEELTDLNQHVQYVHTKFMLVDPMGDWPILVSGSANFSLASTLSNDENMVVLQGPPARAACEGYLVEFMRLFRHFSWREKVVKEARRQSGQDGVLPLASDEARTASGKLCEDASWLSPHLRLHSRLHKQRKMFMAKHAVRDSKAAVAEAAVAEAAVAEAAVAEAAVPEDHHFVKEELPGDRSESENQGEQRLYLSCPFDDKDEAKKMGAKFDWDKQQWYVTPDLERVVRLWGARLTTKWEPLEL